MASQPACSAHISCANIVCKFLQNLTVLSAISGPKNRGVIQTPFGKEITGAYSDWQMSALQHYTPSSSILPAMMLLDCMKGDL